MYKHRQNKAFTLVELIIVIAIIAILTSVSVVGYFAFIGEGEKSSDIQKVTSLNTIIKGSLDYEILNKDDLFDLFKNHDVKEENISLSVENSSLLYSLNLKTVLYKINEEFVFPSGNEDYSTQQEDFYFSSDEYELFLNAYSTSESLTPVTYNDTSSDTTLDPLENLDTDYIEGETEEITPSDPANKDTTNKILYIYTAEEFLYVFNKGSWLLHQTYNKIIIKNDLNLKFNEACLLLNDHTGANLTSVKSIPLEIDGENHIISNLKNPSGYLISSLMYKYELTIKNLTFFNCYFGGAECENVVGIIGKADNKATSHTYEHSIKFVSVTIENSLFRSKTIAAPYIGEVFGRCDISISKDSSTHNVLVISSTAQNAKLIGLLETNSIDTSINFYSRNGEGATLVEPLGVEHDQYEGYQLKNSDRSEDYTLYQVYPTYDILDLNGAKYLYSSNAYLRVHLANKFTFLNEDPCSANATINLNTKDGKPKLYKKINKKDTFIELERCTIPISTFIVIDIGLCP